LSVWETLATSDRQSRQHSWLPLTEHFSPTQSIYESELGSPWSPVLSQADDFPINSSPSLASPHQSFQSRNFSEAALPGEGRSVHQRDPLPFKPTLPLPRQCVAQDPLSSCKLGFCAPHALPSRCWAAQTEIQLIGLSKGPLSCEHCGATKLHHLASMAQTIELRYFKKVILDYLPILWEQDTHGNTCVHFAAGSGASLAQLEALACAGAPMELCNNAGQTFLHVLNTKLYRPDTLPPIMQWALRTKGAMTERDSHKRTVWHSMFQRGVSPDVFRSILPYLRRNRDDMMLLDSENHTPLDCLRSYWNLTNEKMAIDYLNLLQSSGRLPLYFAVNRTAPLDGAVYAGTPVNASAIPALSADVSRLTIGESMKRHESNGPMRSGVDEFLSTYINGGALDCNTSTPLIPFSLQHEWPARSSPLPTNLPEKARRFLFGP
jgi:hypothetical protein